MTDPRFDYVIVGGGSAGCVLANRLSAPAGTRVLLIEAGRDTPPGRVPPEILDSYPRVAYFDPRNTWADLRVYLQPLPHNDPQRPEARRYEQARIMGGGSSLNDMQANRGLPTDYDGWRDMGAAGWAWSDVLPYFRKVERDLDYDGPMHGRDGRIPVRRIMPDVWPGFSLAARDAFAGAGYRDLVDQNAVFKDGFFPIAISNMDDQRVSSAIGYLDSETRQRPGLEIWPNTTLRALAVEDGHVVGVHVRRDGGETQCVRARETILCCGAIHSPALLLRAGIGPVADLQQLGIEVLADRPGVGRNLQEHPTISISAYLPRTARLPDSLRRHIHVGLRYSSGLEDCPAGDMYMVAVSKTGWHPLGRRIGSLLTWINKPQSRGRVWLQSPEPEREPNVAFDLLSDYRDVARLKQGMLLIARLFEHPSLRANAHDPFPTSYNERIRDLGLVTLKNRVLTGALSALLDGPGPLRRLLIDRLITEGASLRDIVEDDDALDRFVRTKAHGVWHASGTCRMGAPDDPLAVVDPAGAVIGVRGLRVVDGSVIPSIPCANTNLPILMIAEKMADAILARHDRVPRHEPTLPGSGEANVAD